MTKVGAIINLADWLQTPAGRHVLAWEQAQLDGCVADVFGFHALQLGLPALDALRDNRMPHRWLANDGIDPETEWPAPPRVPGPGAGGLPALGRAVVLQCDFDALPLASQSLDLVVLPHTLELAVDPHQALREVERVLMPEGRVVILGFNPGSLWALRQRLGHVRQRFGGRAPLFMPQEGQFIGYWRLRDWLRLLSFDIAMGRFGCHGLPVNSQAWLARLQWLDRAGARWWPVLGATYMLVAIKRVRGMRLVGLSRRAGRARKPAAAVLGRSSHQAPAGAELEGLRRAATQGGVPDAHASGNLASVPCGPANTARR